MQSRCLGLRSKAANSGAMFRRRTSGKSLVTHWLASWFQPALRHHSDVFASGRIGDEAQEPHWFLAGVAELVDVIGGDKHDVAGREGASVVAVDDFTAAGQHVHLM